MANANTLEEVGTTTIEDLVLDGSKNKKKAAEILIADLSSRRAGALGVIQAQGLDIRYTFHMILN